MDFLPLLKHPSHAFSSVRLRFAVTNGKFNHESSVDKFLDALTRQTKFPFSTEELRDELKHTFWLLDRVDSAKVLAKKLREHPILIKLWQCGIWIFFLC